MGSKCSTSLRGTGSEVPILILTARDSVQDRVAGLDGGADDYMAKPFSFDELLARMRRRIRTPADIRNSQPCRSGDIHLDLMTRRVTTAGDFEHELTAREFSMLEMFMRHPGQVLSREQLLNGVWGFDYDPGSNVVDVYVRYLRKKLGDDAIRLFVGWATDWLDVRAITVSLATLPPSGDPTTPSPLDDDIGPTDA